jgi:replicative DNA helicase
MEKNLTLPEHLLEPYILKHAAHNRSFFLKIKPYLDTSRERSKSYFSDEKIQQIFNLVVRFFDKYQDFPKKETLKSMMKKIVKDEDISFLMNSMIDEMYSGQIEDLDEQFFEEEVLNFIKEAKIYEAIVESQIDIQSKNFNSIVNRMESAVRINFDKNLGISIRDTTTALDKIREINEVKTISSGFSHFDSMLDGGFRPREITCFSAIPGGFKCVRKDTIIKIRYKIEQEIEIGKLFELLNIEKEGSYEAPSSLEVETPFGFKKVNGLLKTQPNQEWIVKTEEGSSGCFADFHKLESLDGEFDPSNECFWKYVKNLKVGDVVRTKNGWELIKEIYFNGNMSKMFDLNVDDNHSLWTNNFHSHNTGFLGNFAINAFIQGKNVIVYTFETSSERLLMRYYANLAEMSKKEIVLDEDGLKEKIKSIADISSGDLILKEYNANSVSSNDLMAHINDLWMYKKFKPDIIVVDYILIMRTNDKMLSSENSYKYYKTVTEELRNIAKDLYIPILTATQINREGMADRGGSKSTLTGKDISESRGIYDTVDTFVPIVQTAADKKSNRYFLYFDKNRNERTGAKIEYSVDYDHMKLTEKGIFGE